MSLVNPYDRAHELARALSSCEEFKAFQQALTVLQAVPGAEEKLADFMQKQMALDFQKMQSGDSDVDSEQLTLLAKQYQELMAIKEIADFMVAERAFMRIYSDIQTILQKAISPVE